MAAEDGNLNFSRLKVDHFFLSIVFFVTSQVDEDRMTDEMAKLVSLSLSLCCRETSQDCIRIS